MNKLSSTKLENVHNNAVEPQPKPFSVYFSLTSVEDVIETSNLYLVEHSITSLLNLNMTK